MHVLKNCTSLNLALLLDKHSVIIRVIFGVRFGIRKVYVKKQTYMKTETCKLDSRVFWVFLFNVIKIDRYNFELHRFKVGAFFETQCTSCCHECRKLLFDYQTLFSVTSKLALL